MYQEPEDMSPDRDSWPDMKTGQILPAIDSNITVSHTTTSWPAATVQIVTVLAMAAVLITLFMTVWGPW